MTPDKNALSQIKNAVFPNTRNKLNIVILRLYCGAKKKLTFWIPTCCNLSVADH